MIGFGIDHSVNTIMSYNVQNRCARMCQTGKKRIAKLTTCRHF